MKHFLKSRARDILSSMPAAAALSDYLIRREHPVFMFHRILPAGEPCYADEMTATPQVLDDFLAWLVSHYDILPLRELSGAPEGTPSGRKPVCAITFDDGWLDNYRHAFPILAKHKVPATIFLATGFVGTNRHLWQDRVWRSLEIGRGQFDPAEVASKLWGRFPWCPELTTDDISVAGIRRLMMKCSNHDAEEFVTRLEELTGQAFAEHERAFLTWDEVGEMQRGGIDFGSHTHNHTLLTAVSPAAAHEEIRRSKVELENHLGRTVTSFSYPWGRTIGHITRQVAEAGFECAVTAEVALRNGSTNPFLISRIPVSGPVLTKGRGEFAPSTARVSFALSQIRARRKQYQPVQQATRKDRLRIALLIDTIDSWNGGGTEAHIRHLLNALDPRYFETELFLLEATPVDHAAIPCPVRTIQFGRGPKPLQAIWKLRKALKAFRPHIVQTFFPDATFFGTIAAKMAGVPVIIHAERNLGHDVNSRDRLTRQWLRRYAQGFQCNSRAIEAALKQYVEPERIDILHNHLDTGFFRPASAEERAKAKESLGLCRATPIILSVSNLRRVKDLDTCINAAAIVRKTLPEALFVIVGEGELRAALETRIGELGLENTVRLAGLSEDVRPWLAAADIGLLTSRSEGSSNAVLEYMAAALPAVLSDISANRELADGVFFRTGDPADLAARLIDLWEHKEERNRLALEYRERGLQYGAAAFRERAQAYYVRLVSPGEISY